MGFDADNKVMQLCAAGMDKEGEGKAAEAAQLFRQAWNEATNDFEKCTAAHYVARHQDSVADKLAWDETALQLALTATDESVAAALPSLYLNIAKDYEALNDRDNARKHYQQALSCTSHLPDDGYGRMIKQGIIQGMERVK